MLAKINLNTYLHLKKSLLSYDIIKIPMTLIIFYSNGIAICAYM